MPRAGHDPFRAAQGHDPARALPEGRRRQEDGQGHEGAGSLLRRAAPHDPDGDVHHQRHGARRGEPDAQVPRRLLRQRKEQDRPRGANPLRRPHDPVPRLVAGFRVRRQGLPLRPDRPAPQVPRHDLPPGDGLHAPGDPGHLLPAGDRHPGRKRRVHQAARPGAAPGPQAPPRHRPPEDGRGARQGGAQAHGGPAQEAQGERRRGDPARPRGAGRADHRPRDQGPGDGRGAVREQRGARRGRCPDDPREGHPPVRAARDRRPAHHQPPARHARGRRHPLDRRGARRDLQEDASRRAADPRDLPGVLRKPVLQPQALRPLARRPDEAHHEALAPGQGRPRRARADPRRHHRDPAPADQDQRRPGAPRRRRPPRQPSRQVDRRAAREPVPDRSRADGARPQGAHGGAGGRDPDAPRPRQRPAGGRGDQGVLRLQPALPVHGPDQPARRDHPQAPPLGARPRRPDPRARRVRGARRAPDALRPGLPDRDARGAEHRADHLALDVRPGQRVRLHRDALPHGQGREGHRPGALPDGRRGGPLRHRPGEHGARRRGEIHLPEGFGAPQRRVRARPARGNRDDGRVAEADRFGGHGADTRFSSTTTPTGR